MDEVKLLPCPFPHEIKRGPFIERDTEDFFFVRVSCGDCGCAGPFVSIIDNDGQVEEAEAIALWNTRAIEATRPTEQSLGAIPCSHPADQAPSGLGASRFDPERWQPIKTAPTDGTPIMLLSPDGHVGVGYIELSQFNGKPRGQAAWIARVNNTDGSDYTGLHIGGHRPSDATHWMPLPEAPASAIEARRAADSEAGAVHESAGPQDDAHE